MDILADKTARDRQVIFCCCWGEGKVFYFRESIILFYSSCQLTFLFEKLFHDFYKLPASSFSISMNCSKVVCVIYSFIRQRLTVIQRWIRFSYVKETYSKGRKLFIQILQYTRYNDTSEEAKPAIRVEKRLCKWYHSILKISFF